jgi:trans-AT polyketide synthase/acyltransferase/oxidoreductase domain-containing protein
LKGLTLGSLDGGVAYLAPVLVMMCVRRLSFANEGKVNVMTAFVFPGQGSQFRGMGEGLFEAFRDLTRKADEILGLSVERLCLEDPERQLGQTQYTQPALFVVNALAYLQLLRDGRRAPEFVAGHSLGEYNALHAAGAFDFETGLRLVQRRGELMSRARDGGMAAVVGLTEEKVAQILKNRALTSVVIANHNSPTQTVIAGPKCEIARIGRFFEEWEATYLPLSVSGAFHSPLMADAGRQFGEHLGGFAFADPKIPVVSNATARPYEAGAIRDGLVAQITSPVRWTESIRYLVDQGEQEFVEVGPGNVLTKLILAIRKNAPLPCAAANAPIAPPSWAQPDGPPACRAPSADVRGGGPRSGQAMGPRRITAESLGNAQFKRDYGLRYAYLTGSMYRGIASVEMVARVAQAGMLGFFGSGGLALDDLERAVDALGRRLGGGTWGVNLLHRPDDPDAEDLVVDRLLARRVGLVEASAYMRITPALIRYRAMGLRRGRDGRVEAKNRVIAKISRPEVAEAFLSPAPVAMVEAMVASGALSKEQRTLLGEVPMADDLCAEADSGGHTDGAVAYALFPAIRRLRDEMRRTHGYVQRVRVGAAGGIGTPEAAAAAFVLGADFVLTGSINQCTAEAGTSDAVKDLLQQMNVQDTEYAPAGDMFELGAKVQVLRRGLFFASRANRLHELYRFHDSLDSIDARTRAQIEERYFRRTFDEVYREVKAHHPAREIERAERNPKHKMALVFRWYFARANQLALAGDPESKVDCQIPCGPALGAFNVWVKGTPLEDWRNRHADEIGRKLMTEAAEVLNRRFEVLSGETSAEESGAAPADLRALDSVAVNR